MIVGSGRVQLLTATQVHLGLRLGLRLVSSETRLRSWLDEFTTDKIPRDAFDISFARSSGPGGQNVNKLNTKATIRMSAEDWNRVSWIPPAIRHQLVFGKFPFMMKSGGIAVSSQSSRKQADNVEICFHKLGQAIRDTAYVAPERQIEDIDRWDRITKATNEQRLRAKSEKSRKKESRRSRDFD